MLLWAVKWFLISSHTFINMHVVCTLCLQWLPWWPFSFCNFSILIGVVSVIYWSVSPPGRNTQAALALSLLCTPANHIFTEYSDSSLLEPSHFCMLKMRLVCIKVEEKQKGQRKRRRETDSVPALHAFSSNTRSLVFTSTVCTFTTTGHFNQKLCGEENFLLSSSLENLLHWMWGIFSLKSCFKISLSLI